MFFILDGFLITTIVLLGIIILLIIFDNQSIEDNELFFC